MSEYEIHEADGASLVGKVLQLTREDRLVWESTADPNILIAPFRGEYVFQLERSAEPEDTPIGVRYDYSLSVFKDRRALVSFGPRTLVKSMKPQGYDLTPQYVADDEFRELWKRAFFKANKVADEFAKVSQMLDAELAVR